VPAEQDGHPVDSIQTGEVRVYEFEIKNRAGLHIYHPHSHERTASQVYYGLAGGILVRDAEEDRLGLPAGEYELPLVIQDRRFDGDNQFVYGQSMHDRTLGFVGNRILVNGKVDASFEVASRAYRFRVMNGSNSRIYKLAWSDGTPVTVLGVDGGLLERHEIKPYVMLAPGERLDLWMDFSGRAVGSEMVLKSLSFRGALPKMHEAMVERMQGMHSGTGHENGMMGGMEHGGSNGSMMGGMGGAMMGNMMAGMMSHHELPVGSEYPIARFRVTRVATESPNLPSQLSSYRHYRLSDTVNPDHPIPIGISEGPGRMLLNGRPYAFDDIQSFERVPVNTLQFMEIFHAHGGHAGSQVSTRQEASGHGSDDPKTSSGSAGHAATGDTSASGMAGMDSGNASGENSGMKHEGGMGMMGGMGMSGMSHNANASNQTQHSMSGMQHEGGMSGMADMSMMLSMAHPIHLHGQQFQVLSRSMSGDTSADYETVKDGLISSGLKDTVLLMSGEKIRLIKPFEDFKGRFMYHCHNLEHEDLGMMREFEIY
jgi:FtsP/CotA-like multicopper oxidase with cupredoxin domain